MISTTKEFSYFKIADLVMKISNEIQINKEMFDFEIDPIENEKTDLSIDFDDISVNKTFLDAPSNGRIILKDKTLSIYNCADKYVVMYENPIVVGYELQKTKREATIYVDMEAIKLLDTYLVHVDKILEVPTPEQLLLYSIRDIFFFYAQELGRIAIHSASILYKDFVWLFSGPSGAGKSTHVQLWRESGIDFSDFNGDVALLYIRNDIVCVAGLPWSGTSEIYTRNIKALGGIVFIKKGSNDAIYPLLDETAVLEMCSRCLSPNWNRERMELTIDAAIAIASRAAIATATCTLSVDAARSTQNYINDICKSNI